jgi:hypothetical protein
MIFMKTDEFLITFNGNLHFLCSLYALFLLVAFDHENKGNKTQIEELI